MEKGLLNEGNSLALPVRGPIFILDLELEAILHHQEMALYVSIVTEAERGDTPIGGGHSSQQRPSQDVTWPSQVRLRIIQAVPGSRAEAEQD